MVFLLCFPDAVQNEVGRLDMPRTSGVALVLEVSEFESVVRYSIRFIR